MRVHRAATLVALVSSLPSVSYAQCQLQKIYAIGAAQCEQFGKGLDMDGDRIVVGAHAAGDDPPLPCATGPGAAYVFDRVGSGWIQRQRLVASDGGSGDEFGNTVGVSGDRIVVGAEFHDGAVSNSGAAYVFELQGSTWVEVAKLVPSDSTNGHYFARSVAISGDLIACGTRFDKDNGNQAGAAYIFERDAAGNWNEVQKIKASDGDSKDLFGNSIAIDGTRVVVGAYYKGGAAGSKTGAAYVYELQGSTWVETAKLEASDQESNAEFGRSVAVSGNRVLVGATFDDSSGSAYVFELQGSTWVEMGKLEPSNGQSGDRFGESCEIDGDHAVVGSRSANFPQDSGAVFHYAYENGEWVEHAILKPFGASPGDRFGYNCSVSGDVIVGGGPFDHSAFGTAAIFSISGSCAGVPLGSEHNPPGSLVHLSGSSSIGDTLTFGVDNPLGTQAPGSTPMLFVSFSPNPSFPAGTFLPGYGMAAPGASCEVSISSSLFQFQGAPWQGPGIPAPVDLVIPEVPGWIGLVFYAQGLLIDPITPGGVPYGCTQAYQVTIGA